MGIEAAGAFENYESLILRLPKFPVGFRGQPFKLNENTLENGFDKKRHFFAGNLSSLGIEEARKSWPDFRYAFQFAMHSSKTYSQQTLKSINLEEEVSYFKEHPEEYSSILVLVFPDLTDLPNWPKPLLGDTKLNRWFMKKLSPKNIAGIVQSQQEDFIEFEQELRKNPQLVERNSPITGKMEGYKLMLEHTLNKTLYRYLEFLVSFNPNRNTQSQPEPQKIRP